MTDELIVYTSEHRRWRLRVISVALLMIAYTKNN